MGEVFQGTIGLRQAYWQSPFEAIGLLFVLFDTVAIMLENCGHLDLTMVELSTDPAPLIMSKFFRFRVLWP